MTERKQNTDNSERGQADAQHARFVEIARAVSCDEDEVAFDKKLKGITRQKLKIEAKETAG